MLIGNVATISYSYNASCAMSYYGENCSTHCVGADSDAQGHYICDEDGNVVCLEGYIDGPSSSLRCNSKCTLCTAQLTYHRQEKREEV